MSNACLRLLLAVFCGLFWLAAPASAGGEPRPVSLPILTDQSTALTLVGARGERRLAFAELEALGTRRVSTATFWPGDDGTYEGPLLADVLKAAGLEGVEAISVHALDGFSQVIPREDWRRWPIVLATRRDGRPMSTREKGPFRIIYPRDMSPVLADPVYRLRWVWMIREIRAGAPR